MNVTCTNCRKSFFDNDWSNILSLLNKDKVSFILEENYVCNDCIDNSQIGDRLRHNIIDKFIRITNKNVLNVNNFNVNPEHLDKLLIFLKFHKISDFYDWFLKEASRNALLDPSVFNKIGTPSPYPDSIGTLLRFIIYKYGSEFFEHILLYWDKFSASEKRNILKSLPVFGFQYDLDRVIARLDE